MSIIDTFIEKSETSLFKHREVAKEVVFMLCAYSNVQPYHIQHLLRAIGWRIDMDAVLQIGSLLISDGWLQYSTKPIAGKGMSAVYAYDHGPLAKKLLSGENQ